MNSIFGCKKYCNGSLLQYDTGCLSVANNATNVWSVFSKSGACHQCRLIHITDVLPGLTNSTIVDTQYKVILHFVNGNNSFSMDHKFEQHGYYNLTLYEMSHSAISVDLPPENPNIPFWIELWILLVIIIFSIIRKTYTPKLQAFLENKYKIKLGDSILGHGGGDTVAALTSTSTHEGRSQSKGRIKCIDTFRGLTLTLMLFVNFGGGGYWFFRHSYWNGITVADVIFPWFAFIMGMSLLFSLKSEYRKTKSKCQIFWKITKRTAILFGLGLMRNSWSYTNDVNIMRIFGILQRLALAFFITSSIELIFIHRTTAQPWSDGMRGLVADWKIAWPGWLTVLSLTTLHSCLTYLLPVPGCPTGYTGPGLNPTLANCTAGLSGHIDRWLLTPQHIPHTSYGILHEPNGVLGTLTTVMSVYFGVQASRTYTIFKKPSCLLIRWILLATITGIVAGMLCNWSREAGIIPISKNTWSLSLVLAATSTALFIISFLYYLIDLKKSWQGYPLREIGHNSIILYLGSCLLKRSIPFVWAPVDYTSHTNYLLMNTWSTLLWMYIGVILYKKNIIIKI